MTEQIRTGWTRAGTTPRAVARTRAVRQRISARLVHIARAGRDAGMATAEYAIVTLAAVGFAGLLLVILRSDEVRGLLLGIVRRALAGG